MPPKRKAAKQTEAADETPNQVEEVSSSKKGKQTSVEKDIGDAEAVPVKEKRSRAKRGEKKEVTEEEAPKETSKKADKPKKRTKEASPQNGHIEADSKEDVPFEEVPKKKKSKEEKSKEKKDKSDKASSSKKSKKVKEEKSKKEKATAKTDKDSDNSEEEKPKRNRAKKEKSEEPDEDNVKTTKEKSGTPMNKTSSNWDKIDFSCSAKNAKGETYNLKISSWNIGGIKSWIKKECDQYLEAEDPDILCLQEIKCNEAKLPEEVKEWTNYKQYWLGSKKEGYAGVGLLTKEEPLSVTYGLDSPDQDVDGRLITAEYKNYYIVNVYVPNSGRGLTTLPKRLKWNKVFKDYINTLDTKKPVIICGDMNVSHNEIDLARPKSNTKNAGFTPEEREGMTDFITEGYVDTFRELYPDKPDMYTFWSYMGGARSKNIGWRLDYFLVSERIKDTICDNVIRSEVNGSDHCPITLFLKI